MKLHQETGMSELNGAEIVIIGGGAVGCGVAYSLAKAGKTDILLIERADDVGQVTTAQGAGATSSRVDTPRRPGESGAPRGAARPRPRAGDRRTRQPGAPPTSGGQMNRGPQSSWSMRRTRIG
jgi:NADPH-dependent 2,4-dienoyl-CoA reductase/sulfur reductase-like enzyme